MDQNDNHKRDDEAAIMIALFRYGILAPILESKGDHTGLVREIAGKTHHFPGKGPVTYTERTLYNWLNKYKTGGVEALRPSIRKDCGKSRVIDTEILQRAIQLRKENPKRYTSTIIDIMQREGWFEGKQIPHRATFDRHLDRIGASRSQLQVLATKSTIKMHFENFGDLWVGDYHHGPLVLGPDGNPKTSKLGAFIDHATRYPVSHKYYLAEDLASLRDTLLRAFLKWGIPVKTYVDRGAVYRSNQLKYSLLQIGSHLIHSKAYYSQGRGVIEKWWQVADIFESEVRGRNELLTIHELNDLWEAFCELRYCQKVHSEIKTTPNEAIQNVKPQPLDPEVAREIFLVQVTRTVNRKNGCVNIEGRSFLCESFLRKRQVQVRYNPNDLSHVLIFMDGKRVQKAFPQPLNAKPEPTPDPEPITQSVDYLQLLRRDYDKQLMEHAKPLIYTNLSVDPEFNLERFLDVICQLTGVDLSPLDKKEATEFWETFGPLPEALVRIGCEHAVRLHCRGRHIRVYLNAVRLLVTAHWKQHLEKESK
jgi:transposase InsO family protein